MVVRARQVTFETQGVWRMSFKVGDRVKVVKIRPGLGADIGDTAVVIGVSSPGVVVIKWDNGRLGSSYYADQFELLNFKVGDRVVYDGKSSSMAARAGATGIVQEIVEDMIDIKWDENELRNGQNHGGYFAKHFNVITPKIDYLQITRELVGGR